MDNGEEVDNVGAAQGAIAGEHLAGGMRGGTGFRMGLRMYMRREVVDVSAAQGAIAGEHLAGGREGRGGERGEDEGVGLRMWMRGGGGTSGGGERYIPCAR